MENQTRQCYLFCAWLIALAAMVITLYGTYVMHQPACPLCWFQRICFYPLVIILGIAAFRDDASIVPYVILLPIFGAIFALYQYLEQMIPHFAPIDVCSNSGIKCSNIHFLWLGFITYPFLSIIASLVILLLLCLAYRRRNPR